MGFLLIQNPVKVAPSVEMMSTLGLSASRGQSGKIGQFGTGFPYSLALLARHGLLEGTKICLGRDVYTFSIDEKRVNDANGHKHLSRTIVMKKQNGGTYPLNISIDFGGIDWTDIRLAIREFCSNAIDGVYEYGGSPSKDIVIDTNIPDEGRMTRAKEGFIRVYIPLTDDIQNYVDELPTYFRCLQPGYNPDRSVWLNTSEGPALIYRKGVLVGKFGERSLFCYNINDIHINESRIVDSWTARDACATAIAKSESASIIGKFLSHRLNPNKSDKYFEDDLYIHNMKPGRLWYEDAEQEERCKQAFTEAVKNTVGHRIVCTSPIAAKIVTSKGLDALTVDSDLEEIVRSHGVRTADDVLNRDELSGKITHPPTQPVIFMVDRVWDILTKHNMCNGKDKPDVMCFSQHTTEGGMSGYYRPGGNTIYIRSDHADGITTYSMSTVIEEICHYVSGAMDETREFQTFAFNLAAKLALEGWSR